MAEYVVKVGKKGGEEEERLQREEEERIQREEEEKKERERKARAEQEKKALEEAERQKREEEKARQEEQERLRRKNIWDNSKEIITIKTTQYKKGGFLGFEKEKSEIENQVEIKRNSNGMKFTLIPAGEFMMGSESMFSDKTPVHRVRISKPFYLGTYPVTQREWKAVMGVNPSCFKGDDLPVEEVSWNDVQEFIKKLNEKEGTDRYRLPSEAEWEYACRAGTTTKYPFGDFKSNLDNHLLTQSLFNLSILPFFRHSLILASFLSPHPV